MKKENYLTEEFYNDPFLALNILNNLISSDDFETEKDMYGNGEFLFMSVSDNDATRKILSPVINDFEAYKNKENLDYVGNLKGKIGLCFLQYIHKNHFDWDNEIVWNEDSEKFNSRGELPSCLD